MTLEPSELLERLSETLRSEIGPAVGDEYTRTQAYMASVILARVAKQLASAADHRDAEQADLDRLHRGLESLVGVAPDAVVSAARRARSAATIASLGPLIEAIYSWGIDRPEAAEALTAVRAALRRDIDRRMEIAT